MDVARCTGFDAAAPLLGTESELEGLHVAVLSPSAPASSPVLDAAGVAEFSWEPADAGVWKLGCSGELVERRQDALL